MTHAPAVKAKKSTENVSEEFELQQAVPPDGGWGWVVAFASFAIHIVTDGITYSFGIFFLEFSTYFNESKGYTAWIASILVGVTLCSGPISSSFVNRYGCRSVTIAGAILAATCLVIGSFANSVLILIITVGFGAGFGFGLIYLPAIVSVTMYFEKYRSLATGIAVCGSGFGTVIFSPLTDQLIITFGWRGAMLIIAAIVLNCIIFGALFRPLEPIKVPKASLTINENDAQAFLDKPINGNSSNNNLDFPTRSYSTNEAIRKHDKTHQFKPQNGEKSRLKQAISQPLLSAGNEEKTMKDFGRSESGTMYRPDALYQGSLANLAQLRSRGDVSELSRYGSLRRKSCSIAQEQNIVCGCIPCSRETKDTLKEMMDFSLFKDPIFILFVVSNFCTSIGFNIPYVYIAAQAQELDLPPEQGGYLISCIGFANTIGRIVLGYFSDKAYVNRLWVYNACLTVCGAATMLSILCRDFYSLILYTMVFGFTIGAYVGLTSVILVDLLGLDKLTNAFGLLLLFQGIASLVGPPFAGFLYDVTLSYGPGFLLSGGAIAGSGLILFAIPALQRCVARKAKLQEHDLHHVHHPGNEMVPL